MKCFILSALFMLANVGICPATNIIGTWYGLQYGSPMTVVINDSTMTFGNPAWSSMCFTTNYKISDYRGDTFDIDLANVSGMGGKGIGQFKSPDNLKIAVVLGPSASIQRPAKFEDVEGMVNSMIINISKNPSNFVSAIDRYVDAPAHASLAFERNRRLGHGINLNNVVDGNSHEGNPADQPFTDEDAKKIADAGFNSVRLPVCWVKHAQPRAPYTIDADFFNKVDTIVKRCLNQGLAVSIDVHYYPYINMHYADSVLTYDQNLERLVIFWEQIAERYKHYPEEVYFDLLNEPSPALDVARYNKLISQIIPIVRKSNPTRTIIIGTPSLGQHWTLGELQFPKDEWNLIVQAHYYLPHTFSHQGLSYAPGAEKDGVEWLGTEDEKSTIRRDFDYCALWSRCQYRPINIGEFGVNEVADVDSRARYLGFMREMIDSHDFSFHLWGYRECFNIMDPATGTWEPKALAALRNKKQ